MMHLSEEMLKKIVSNQNKRSEKNEQTAIELHDLLARNLNELQCKSIDSTRMSYNYGNELRAYFHNLSRLSCQPNEEFNQAQYESFGGYDWKAQGGSFGVLTPSPTATESHSRSTVFSSSSPCPDYGDFSQFTSRDYELLKEGHFEDRSILARNSSTRDEYDSLRRDAFFSKLRRNNEEENIYTAEMVHQLVKNNRDLEKKRIVSNKVFVGGISNNMDRATINKFFAQFGCVFVDWPIKVPKQNSRLKSHTISSYSYLFLVYVDEESVLKLTKQCHNPSYNEFFVSVPGYDENMIQIRPWYLENAFYIHPDAEDKKVIDIHRTVFVGGLPRIVTAEEISFLFSEFGKVLLVTIDVDQDYGYPKGAARVTFEKDSSFSMALERKYLKFDNIDSSKTTIEIKPYVMEDVGCDQCGGLWFNPFLDILTNMTNSLEKINEKKKVDEYNKKAFDMWSFNNPISHRNEWNIFGLSFGFENMNMNGNGPNEMENKREELCDIFMDKNDQESKALYTGSMEFYKMAKSFNLHKQKKMNIRGNEFPVGPDLWNLFLPQPYLGMSNEMAQLQIEQQIQSHLKLKRGNVYRNKSSYCKDKPCRQYYCSSCSHKLHSIRGPSQHNLLPSGKPERRPRKDKNMYLVRQ